MKQHLGLFLKGVAMGAANVIPGVSGGTIALITGIYEELITSIKSFDLTAIRLLAGFRIKEFAAHVNLGFLFTLFFGIAVSILSLARLFEYLLAYQEVLIMAFFFGLILASVYFVGKTVDMWSAGALVAFLIGTGVAVGIALVTPATENAAFWYVFICGIAAICSMILPGLSGSFVLIIMGNYLLVLGGINRFDMGILVPLGLGCVFGMIAFSQVLAWVFKHYRDITIALMTGFILGSLTIIWPWKAETYLLDAAGNPVLKDSGEQIINGYVWLLPDWGMMETWLAIGLMLIGGLALWGIERGAAKKPA